MTEEPSGRRFDAPTLEGRHIFLKPVTTDDYRFLQQAETSTQLGARWRFRGATPSPEQWGQATFGSSLAQFLVFAKQRPEPIGLAAAYQANFQDGYAHVAAARFDPGRRSPLMMLGFGVFLHYVFSCWDLRKLYMEVPEYNYDQLASAGGTLFEVEGRLKHHSFLAGELWDQLVLAIYREAWQERAPAFLRVEGLAS